MREFLIRATNAPVLFRQADEDGDYALVLPSGSGERLLTVPALHEADFTFHGRTGSTSEEIADFIAKIALGSGADLIRLPLLSNLEAEALEGHLRRKLPAWRFDSFLSAVAPLASKAAGYSLKSASLRRASSSATASGLQVTVEDRLPIDEVRQMHRQKWGDNRSPTFFSMLAHLVEHDCAELTTVRDEAGTLIASHLDILGTSTRHYYHSASATEAFPGAGSAALAASWERFLASDTEQIYSFGRGSERYKYRYATGYRELFEVRGHSVPIRSSRTRS